MADTETARQWHHSLPHTVTVLPQGWATPPGGCALGTQRLMLKMLKMQQNKIVVLYFL